MGQKNKALKKVLVADSTHLMRVMIKNFIEDKYEVIEASDGNEVIYYLKKFGPHGNDTIFAAIISLELPDYTAYQLTAKIREKFNKKTLPVLLMTSNNSHNVIINALEAGMNDYLLKPFPQELIISKLAKLEHTIPKHNVKQSESLCKIPFFKGVPEDEVAYALKTCSKTLSLKKDAVICQQNDRNYDLFILLDGKCDVIFNDQKVSEILPVDIIGEMGFFEKTPRSATAIASEKSTVIVLAQESFEDFLNDDRAISEIICKNIIHTFSKRIKRTNSVLDKLTTDFQDLFSY